MTSRDVLRKKTAYEARYYVRQFSDGNTVTPLQLPKGSTLTRRVPCLSEGEQFAPSEVVTALQIVTIVASPVTIFASFRLPSPAASLYTSQRSVFLANKIKDGPRSVQQSLPCEIRIPSRFSSLQHHGEEVRQEPFGRGRKETHARCLQMENKLSQEKDLQPTSCPLSLLRCRDAYEGRARR